MTYYAQVDGSGNVLSVIQSDGPPQIDGDWSAVVGGIPPRAGEAHEMRLQGGALVWIDPRTISQAREDRWEVIKAARTAAIDAPLATPYGTFDCGPADRTNITDAITLLQTMASLGTPTTVTFTLADNSVVTLTTEQMINVGLLLGQKIQSAYAIGRDLRAAIDNAASVEALESISWPT